jgi:spore germination protein YaaH
MRDLLKRHLTPVRVTIAAVILALVPAKLLTLTAPSHSSEADKTAPSPPSRDDRETQTSGGLALKAMCEQVMAARPLAMYYTTGGASGLDSILAHASDMTILAPQSYWLDMKGNIQGGIPAPTLEAARQSGLPVMALLANDDFSRRVASRLLHDRRLQKRVIRDLAGIARQENLLGFQLDLENIDPDEINLYTRFVHEAAKEFHKDGRLLSVAVVPRFLDSVPGQWAAAYDYPGLAHAADFLTLMAYDNSGRLGPPGPIAGYDWVKNALEYARTRVPTDKILLGIALYGREWTDDGRSLQARSMPYPETKALLSRLSLTPRWNEKHRSPWFKYEESGTVRSVWYENARSIQEKVKLVDRYHLRGFAAWRLGMEDPRIWPMLSAMQEGQPRASERRQASGF